MNRLHRGVFEGPTGRLVQLTELTPQQMHVLQAAKVAPPRRFEAIDPAPTE
jgi:hypothetical protein